MQAGIGNQLVNYSPKTNKPNHPTKKKTDLYNELSNRKKVNTSIPPSLLLLLLIYTNKVE
jgi:hypothetical protein